MNEHQITLYPLKFEPILKEKVWGGQKLQELFNKKDGDKIGESWELSGVENNISIVSNGRLKGKSLNQLLEEYKEQLLGQEEYAAYGNKFPLLFKFIDAGDVLSVQVHPDNELALRRHNSFGKTEMWYVMDADDDANLIIGFTEPMDTGKYVSYLESGTLPEVLKKEKVERGDAFVLLPGTVHAIGAGVVLAEIQQTSDITYRIYDWDRPDVDGQMRELHTELALEAINFDAGDVRSKYYEQMDIPVQIGKTDFFAVNKFTLTKPTIRTMDFATSFKVYMCVEGEAVVTANGFSEKIVSGETILIPASLEEVDFDTTNASFLETYIP